MNKMTLAHTHEDKNIYVKKGKNMTGYYKIT